MKRPNLVSVPARGRRVAPPAHKRRRRVLLAQTWWEDRVLRGVADYAVKHDWELDCRMRWTHQLPSDASSVDGVIVNIGLSNALRIAGGALVEFVHQAGLPVVDMQEFSDVFHAPKVIVPQAEIGRLAARHLLELGYRDLGYVTFAENELERARREGFRAEVETARHRFLEFTPESLEAALPNLPAATGLCALNDLNALQVVRLCLDAGRKVPEEFAVLGADDTDILCDLALVPLSSVSCNYEHQGYEAAALLDRMMGGDTTPVGRINIMPGCVKVRRSTDSVAMPDLDAAKMLRFLRDHFREACSISLVAEELGVSLRLVQIAFRKHMGLTPLQELTRLRVDEAKSRLLEEKPAKLEQIATECGFSNRFHFIQAFRRTAGKSPRAWREENWSGAR